MFTLKDLLDLMYYTGVAALIVSGAFIGAVVFNYFKKSKR